MYKNLENIFKYPSLADKFAVTSSGGEVRSVFNASTRSVIRRRSSLLEVPWRRIHNVIALAMSICVAFSNKVMGTPELPLPIKRHEAPKYDIFSWYWKRMFSAFCMFFKSTSPAWGEVTCVLHASARDVIIKSRT